MHCIVLSTESEAFPRCLRPVKGRAALDYLIDDIILQKDISSISLIADKHSLPLISKHLKNAFPQLTIPVFKAAPLSSIFSQEDDVLIMQAAVSTSLKLQDFIRYFKQFKTITKAAYDKTSPKEIPFILIPKKEFHHVDAIPDTLETHTYNCGSGYCAL
jgi:hypothetical protein